MRIVVRERGRDDAITRLAAMPGRIRKSLLVCVFALTLAGCGSGDDGTIPSDEADQLLSLLAAVQNAAEDGDCDLAQGSAEEFVNRVNNLPEDVDPDVASALTKAATNLDDLASDPSECTATGTSGEAGVESTTSTTTTTTEPTSTTESTTTSSTESTSTDEETTTVEPPENQPPQEDQNTQPPTGQGQGQQGGAGGGGPASGGVTGGGNAG